MNEDDVSNRFVELRDRISEVGGRLEAKLDMVIAGMDRLADRDRAQQAAPNGSVLLNLTTKQHAALQMLMSGKSNKEIAERFSVSENTAKVYVRGIAAKLGVNTRTQIVLRATPLMEGIDDDDYMMISGGLPKAWDRSYSEPDKYAGLYRH